MVHDPDCLTTLDLGRAHVMWIMMGGTAVVKNSSHTQAFSQQASEISAHSVLISVKV